MCEVGQYHDVTELASGLGDRWEVWVIHVEGMKRTVAKQMVSAIAYDNAQSVRALIETAASAAHFWVEEEERRGQG